MVVKFLKYLFFFSLLTAFAENSEPSSRGPEDLQAASASSGQPVRDFLSLKAVPLDTSLLRSSGRLFFINAEYHENTALEDISAGAYLLGKGAYAEDFTVVNSDSLEINGLQQKIKSSLEILAENPEGMRMLVALQEKLEQKNELVIFTLGKRAELVTSGCLDNLFEGDYVTDKTFLFQDPGLHHLCINQESLENSFVYELRARRKIEVSTGKRADFYLLVPTSQPFHMVIAHELIHVIHALTKDQIKIKTPREIYEWISEIILLDHEAEQIFKEREEAIPRLWTNSSEVRAILGSPDLDLNEITELRLRLAFNLAPRIYHKGGIGESDPRKSVYELAGILDPALRRALPDYDAFTNEMTQQPLFPTEDGGALIHFHGWLGGKYNPLYSESSLGSSAYNVSSGGASTRTSAEVSPAHSEGGSGSEREEGES